MTPAAAYKKGLKEGPGEKTRNHVLKDPYYAYIYACFVEKAPHNNTRTAVCKNEVYGYWYAKEIDKKATDETRKSVCQGKKENLKLFYALYVDSWSHPDIVVQLNPVRKAIADEYTEFE